MGDLGDEDDGVRTWGTMSDMVTLTSRTVSRSFNICQCISLRLTVVMSWYAGALKKVFSAYERSQHDHDNSEQCTMYLSEDA